MLKKTSITFMKSVIRQEVRQHAFENREGARLCIHYTALEG